MKVPGPDGEFGFGGHCFPKDTEALLKYAKDKNIKLNMLKKAVEINNKVR
jgi:UDP-glucose 6-dehydrogenase